MRNETKQPCAHAGCNSPSKARGLCSSHWHQARRGKIPLPPVSFIRRIGLSCLIEGCDRPRKGAGLCGMHYERRARSGDVGEAATRQGPRGNGTITWAGYRKIQVDGGLVLEHRQVMARLLGRPLKRNEEVHHKDGDKLNNHPSNLELWARSQPPGQRIEDRIAFSKAVLTEYGINHMAFNASEFLSGALACV